MKSLRWSLLVTGLAFGSVSVVLAGIKMISLATLTLFVVLLGMAVSVGLAMSGDGLQQKTVASMLYVEPK